MPKIPGVNHLHAIRAFERAGFVILRQGKHVIMTKDGRLLIIPRQNPVNAITMGAIVRDSGMSIEEFKKLL
jgi:predicted RNA binding protein YcfA (HicA-like mRNA interferase family)